MALLNSYHFTEGSGTTLNDKVGSADGTLNGSSLPTWAGAGELYGGRYLTFVGGNGTSTGNYNRVNLSPRTDFEKTGASDFTFSCYIRTTKADAVDHAILVVNDNSAALLTRGLWLDASEQSQLFLGDGSSTKNSTSVGAVINDGKWHILMNTFLGGGTEEGRIYVDGVEMGNNLTGALGTGNLYGAAAVTAIGVDYTGSTYRRDFDGDIAHLANYDSVVTPAMGKNMFGLFKGFF